MTCVSVHVQWWCMRMWHVGSLAKAAADEVECPKMPAMQGVTNW